jgi:hypothetical protein
MRSSARSPWIKNINDQPGTGDRNERANLSPVPGCYGFLSVTRGSALRARPWLPSACAFGALSAPSALRARPWLPSVCAFGALSAPSALRARPWLPYLGAFSALCSGLLGAR